MGSNGRLRSRPAAVAEGSSLPEGVHALDLGRGAEALLAVPPGPSEPRPLLVFLHGAGGSGANSLRVVGAVAGARGIVVLAPSSVAATWDLVAGGLGRDVSLIDAALEEAFGRTAVSRTALGGFSDGASYALSLGLANGDLFEAVLAFSPGFVAPPRREGRPRIWVTHGTGDRVLPVDRCGRRVVRRLTADGYAVTYEEVDGGHAIPPDRITAGLDHWLGSG
jgi:phospholipase/carboxylesterase